MDKSEDTPWHVEEAVTFPPTVPMANNVAMKLHAFWPYAVEVWFAQADAQFVIKAVTVSKTKFYHTVAVLPQEGAAQILNLIRAPPARTLFITLYSLNDYKRFEALRRSPKLKLWL